MITFEIVIKERDAELYIKMLDGRYGYGIYCGDTGSFSPAIYSEQKVIDLITAKLAHYVERNYRYSTDLARRWELRTISKPVPVQLSLWDMVA